MSEANERAWMLSDNISGTSDSEGYWYYPHYPILLGSMKFFCGKTVVSQCRNNS